MERNPFRSLTNPPSGSTPVLSLSAVRYPAALLTCLGALVLWFYSPVAHQAPFSIFITSVIISARFFGFGPAVLCTASSGLLLYHFAIPFQTRWLNSVSDYERMALFVGISLLTAGLARQRSRAQLIADATRERMAAIVESSQDAIFSTSREGIITSWNKGAEMLYGYRAEEAVGRHVSLTAPPERAEEVHLNTQRLARGESVASYQTQRLRKDGSRITVLLSVSPLRDRLGNILGSSAIARDVSAQAQAEEALRKNEKLATAGRLAATVAHEINSPLESVTNLLYLARRDPDRQISYLQMAEKEVQRVAEIAQRTLSFVRESPLSSGINLAEMIDQVVAAYGRRLEAAHIAVRCEVLADARVTGYRGELRQLFSNLINNAIEACGSGGQLRIRISRGAEWSTGGTGIRVSIADTGSGIAPKDMPHIFEPFYTTKRDIGTGLGLWLSHGIVEKHGGTILVRSRSEGHATGTVFSVFLPEAGPAVKAA